MIVFIQTQGNTREDSKNHTGNKRETQRKIREQSQFTDENDITGLFIII